MVFIKSSLATLLVGAIALLNNKVYAEDEEPFTKCNKPGHFAITYDDGPFQYTGELLNLLKEEGVKATFFINGENFWGDISDNDEAKRVLKQAYDDGHQIGSHTWSHKSLPSLSDDEFNSEISKVEDLISEITGKKPTCLRPPYGDYDKNVMSKLKSRKYSVVNWNVDTKDYESHNLDSEKELYNEEIGDTSEGYISLSHDVYQQTTTELTRSLIKYVKEKGFTFATVAECLDISPYRD